MMTFHLLWSPGSPLAKILLLAPLTWFVACIVTAEIRKNIISVVQVTKAFLM